MKSLLILTIVLFTFGCHRTTERERNTGIFSAYIQKEFDAQIPDSLHYFILVPKLVCKGCATDELLELSTLTDESDRKQITYITSNPELFSPELRQKINLLFDGRGTLDRLNLEIANLTLVETKNRQVNFIKPFYADEGKSLASFLKLSNEKSTR